MVLPRYFFYAVFFTTMLLTYVVLYPQNLLGHNIIALMFGISACLILWNETLRIRREAPFRIKKQFVLKRGYIKVFCTTNEMKKVELKKRVLTYFCLAALLGITLIVMPLFPIISKYESASELSPIDFFVKAVNSAQAEGYFDDGGSGIMDGTHNGILGAYGIYDIATLLIGCIAGLTTFYFASKRLK